MFLIDKFQEFYAEVLQLRGRVAEGSWIFQGGGSANPAAEPRESRIGVWRKLAGLLERQSLDAARDGGDFGLEIYRRAQYAQAALADEIFINLNHWPERESWREQLLEAKLFGTHSAGEQLFERIDTLLRDRDTLYGELARIYLMVLALGFQGKYRGRPDADQEIASYRRQLFRFIYTRYPQVVQGEERVMPQAYAATLNEGNVTELPYLKPWLWTLALIIVIWLAGSHLLWRNAIADLEPMVNEIVGTVPAGVGP